MKDIGRIEIESGPLALGAQFTAVDAEGNRHKLTNVRGAVLRMEVGRPNTLDLDTVLASVRSEARAGTVLVSCPFCDLSHSHRIGT